MIFLNVSDFTTPQFSASKQRDVWVSASGTGTLLLEIKGEDGVYRAFPESTFAIPAQREQARAWLDAQPKDAG